jgi:hypothetical protein
MKRLPGVFSLLLFVWAPTGAQEVPNVASHPPASTAADASRAKLVPSAIPRVIQFRGSLVRIQGAAKAEVAGVVFALYEQQDSTTPLWTETQNVELDEQGQYEVLLGATQNEGLPLDMFTSSRARWLAAQPTSPGLAAPARVILVGVPYALKATDAEMLGGRPASAYALSGAANGAHPAESSGASSAVVTAGPVKNLSVMTPTPGGTAGRIPKFSAGIRLSTLLLPIREPTSGSGSRLRPTSWTWPETSARRGWC